MEGQYTRWQCVICTYLNHHLNTSCVVCGFALSSNDTLLDDQINSNSRDPFKEESNFSLDHQASGGKSKTCINICIMNDLFYITPKLVKNVYFIMTCTEASVASF